jgi:hypothetical protein
MFTAAVCSAILREARFVAIYFGQAWDFLASALRFRPSQLH